MYSEHFRIFGSLGYQLLQELLQKEPKSERSDEELRVPGPPLEAWGRGTLRL